ncbi:MAG: hypothetical protein J5I65_12135 [Aridibacter famidurans]|nr:hypothetical protein [Aridibacter famidurans]
MIACESARTVHDSLVEARYFTKYAYFWYKTAAERHEQQWLRTVESTSMNTERLARLQTITAYQEYVVNIAGTMLDIAGLLAGLEDLASDPKKLDEMSRLEFLSRLDTLYEASKSFESARNTLDTQDPDIRVFNIEDSDINNAKSTLSDIKTIVEEAASNGRDWRATLRSAKSLRSIGQIAGRYLRAFAQSEIDERKALADEYARDISAAERVLAASFRDFRTFAARRDAAEDAFRSVESLFDTDGEANWLRCTAKLSIACGGFRSFPEERVPDYAAVTFYGDDIELATAGDPSAWGRAIPFLDTRIENIADSFRSLEIVDVSPSLTLEKTHFEPEESFVAGFSAPACFGLSSWVAVRKSGSPVNSATVPFDDRRRITRGTRGELGFGAPEEEGTYELILYDAAGGRVAFSLPFSVGEENEGPLGTSLSIFCSADGPTGSGRLSGELIVNGEPTEGHRVDIRLLYAEGERKSRSIRTGPEGKFDSSLPINDGGKGRVQASAVVAGKRIFSDQCVFGDPGKPIPAGHGRLTIVALDGLGDAVSGSRVWIFRSKTDSEVASAWEREFDLPAGVSYDIRVHSDVPMEAKGITLTEGRERIVLVSGHGRLRIVSYDGSGTLRRGSRVIVRRSGSESDFAGGWKREFDLPSGLFYDIGVFLDGDFVWRRGVSVEAHRENILFIGAPRTAPSPDASVSINCGGSADRGLVTGRISGGDGFVRLHLEYSDGEKLFKRVRTDQNGRFSARFEFDRERRGSVRAMTVAEGKEIWSRTCEL